MNEMVWLGRHVDLGDIAERILFAADEQQWPIDGEFCSGHDTCDRGAIGAVLA